MKRKRKQQESKLPRSIRRLFPKLKYVTDSTKAVAVTVTSRDCAAGKRMVGAECALAKATRRQYNADGAVIGISFSYIIQGENAVRFTTPVTVAREIVSFDRHSDFAPGEYKLSPVSPSQRLGHAHPSGPSSTRSPNRMVHKHTVRVRESR